MQEETVSLSAGMLPTFSFEFQSTGSGFQSGTNAPGTVLIAFVFPKGSGGSGFGCESSPPLQKM